MSDADRESESSAHPDHHLWRNGRLWWIAFTFYSHEGRKYRVRRSLRTSEVDAARARRDQLLAQYAGRPGWRLALRFAVPRKRGVGRLIEGLRLFESARVRRCA